MGNDDFINDDIFGEEGIDETISSDYEASDIVENDNGQTFSREEVEEWRELVEAANHLISTGELSEENALQVIQGVYGEYLQQRDMQEALEEGLKPGDISSEAWNMYNDNIGKMTIKQCVEATDKFLDGFLGDDRPRSGKRVTKSKVEPFLAGFEEYGW